MIDLLVTSIVAVFTGLLSGPSPAATPTGLWQSADTQAEARFYACGDNLCARLTKARQGSGKMLIDNAAKTNHNMWEGPLLDVENGRVGAGIITMQGRDTLSLKSCTAILICRTDMWRRVR